jgi:tryptophan-rich sensory protein
MLLTNSVFLLFFIPEKIFSHTEKQRYDGWYNNLAHPDWGAVGELVFFMSIALHLLKFEYILKLGFEQDI